MEILCQKVIRLGNFGEIPLVAIGDIAFPKYAWLLKMYNENTRDKKRKYYSKKLRGTRAFMKNVYGMLNGSWRFLYKNTECRLPNLRHHGMYCIA